MNFEGIVEIVGRPKPFGRAFRANLKLEDGAWLSVIGSTAEEVAGKLERIKKGARIKATCEVRYWGRDKSKVDYIVREIAVQDVESITKKLFDENAELSREEISAVKEHLQKCLEQCSSEKHLRSFLKLLQFGVEDLFPFHWKQSSELQTLVKKFFSDSLLSEVELFQIKACIWQWIIAAPEKPEGWEERLAACKTKAQLMDYVRSFLLPNGIDPFQ